MSECPMPVLAFLQNIGWTEWLVILVVGVLLFGRRLPEVGRNLGRSFVEFKRGLNEAQREITDAAKEDETAKTEKTVKPSAAAPKTDAGSGDNQPPSSE